MYSMNNYNYPAVFNQMANTLAGKNLYFYKIYLLIGLQEKYEWVNIVIKTYLIPKNNL